MEQVVQRADGCSLLGNIQGQVGWSSEPHDLAKDASAHCRGLGEIIFKSPFYPKPFYDSSSKRYF